jgi:hypothetical protein
MPRYLIAIASDGNEAVVTARTHGNTNHTTGLPYEPFQQCETAAEHHSACALLKTSLRNHKPTRKDVAGGRWKVGGIQESNQSNRVNLHTSISDQENSGDSGLLLF